MQTETAIETMTGTMTTPASITTAIAPPAGFTTDEARLAAVRARDPRADGAFYYAVASTGVYCRPTCPARPARAENISFHVTPDAAERAGFRACKRCRPRDASADADRARLVAEARARIQTAEAPVRLHDLAAAAGLSPFHFHRLFKRHTGMTPRAYAAAFRLQRFGAAVRVEPSVTAAIYEAGYSSSSRFYEGGRALGMAPSELRRGGAGLTLQLAVRRCSLGQVLIAASDRGVCAISFGDRPAELTRDLRARFPRAVIHEPGAGDAAGARRLDALAAQVVALVDATDVSADLPLDLVGTAFQQRVWRALRDIPAGETVTYAELARRLGVPGAARAVGAACGANPVAVAVPCHRVVRGDGAPGGYRWGVPRKRALLAREAAGRRR
jgi:AraC family transcriptional regulator, regulatory protein of adaptative response / methylated-DNA-[protein]-cysteine methyltransferase